MLPARTWQVCASSCKRTHTDLRCARCADPANEDRRNINWATRPLLWQLAPLTQVESTIGLSCYMFTFSLFVTHTDPHFCTTTRLRQVFQSEAECQGKTISFSFHHSQCWNFTSCPSGGCKWENSAFNQWLRAWDCLCETDRQADRAALCILTPPASQHLLLGAFRWSAATDVDSSNPSPSPSSDHTEVLIMTTTPALLPLQDVLLPDFCHADPKSSSGLQISVHQQGFGLTAQTSARCHCSASEKSLHR